MAGATFEGELGATCVGAEAASGCGAVGEDPLELLDGFDAGAGALEAAGAAAVGG